MTKAAARSRVHRRVHLDYLGVKRFDPDGNLVGECRFCGLLTSTAYTRSVRAIPYLRRKVDRVISRAGFDPSSHSGKALVNVLETLSARRSVSDRRRHALSVCAGDPAARRAPTGARAAAARPLRPLRLDPGLHSARPLRQPRSGQRSATISPRLSRGACAPSIRSSRKARWCACISSSGATRAKRQMSTAPFSIARSKRSCAAGSTGLPTRSWPRIRREKDVRCSRAIARPSRSIIARSIRRLRRSPISAWSRR